jgi:hypothetical protein
LLSQTAAAYIPGSGLPDAGFVLQGSDSSTPDRFLPGIKISKRRNAMCNFFSAVFTKTKMYAFYGVDSHEDIIRLAGIKESNVRGEINLVRCELTPNNPMTLDFDQWNFRVDQDLIPDWFDREKAHKQMINYLKKAPAIIKDVDSIYEQYYFATAKIDRMVGRSSILFMIGSSQVGEMIGSSQVGEMWGSSQVGKMIGSSQVGKMWDSSQVGKMIGSSQVGEMWGSSQVGEMWDSSQVGKMIGSSQVKEDKRKK